MSATCVERQKHTQKQSELLDRWGTLMPSLSDLAFLIPIAVLFWCATGVGWLLTDSDTGWHIRTGEWILKNGRVPAVDIFSFTRSGEPWIAWEWLTDLMMALAHRAYGLAGVVLLALLLLGATSVCIYRSAVAGCGHRLIAFALTWLAMAAGTIHWLARPHLVTPLMAAIFCRILDSVEKERNPTWLRSLPPLTMLWANLHGGFFVGIALISIYAIGVAAEELIHGSRQNAWGARTGCGMWREWKRSRRGVAVLASSIAGIRTSGRPSRHPARPGRHLSDELRAPAVQSI